MCCLSRTCPVPHHCVAPNIAAERDSLVTDLRRAGRVACVEYRHDAAPAGDGRTATGDGYHADGILAVVFLAPPTQADENEVQAVVQRIRKLAEAAARNTAHPENPIQPQK